MNIERGREQEPCSRVSPHVNAGRGKLLSYGYPTVRISARLLCRAFFLYKIPITTCETQVYIMRPSVPPLSSTATARRPREFKHVSMTPHARSSQHRPRCGRLLSGNPSRLLPDPARLQSPGEQFYTDSAGQRAHPFKSRGDPAPKQVGQRKVPCTILNATATTRKSVCWRLKKHPNLATANFVSLWPPRGSRSPVRMRQWTICSRAWTRPSTALVAGATLIAHTLVGAHNEHFLHHRRRGRNYRSCRFFGSAPLNKSLDAP